MKHFLLTRFNLKNKAWKKTNDEVHKGLTEIWLDQRFDLFKTYCLPSVINQTSKKFIWILIFDIDTPLKYQTEINILTREHFNITVIYSDGFNELLPAIKSEIKTHIEKDDNYIISTRLDNDDIIHKDFIKTIQNLFNPIENLVIDLRKGYQLILENEAEIREFYDCYNPFISLVEATGNYSTVLSKEHKNWNQNPLKINKKKHLWIQMIHNQNQANRKTNHLKRLRKFNPINFGININTAEFGIIENLFYNFKLLPLRLFYSAKSIIKSLIKV